MARVSSRELDDDGRDDTFGLPDDPGASAEADTVGLSDTPPGLDSLVVLQRARARLLGDDAAPVRIGRYTVKRKLGSGGMGVVYEALDPDLDRAVALKVLRTEIERGDEQREWLTREAKALAKLSHPNVVHVYEVGRHEGQVYLAMELVEGRTLRRWVSEDEPAWSEIVAKYLQAGRGLLAAHEAGIVHRDFKPDNALVGNDGRVRVLDFGLARPELDDTPLFRTRGATGDDERQDDPTMTATIVGTPAYMDPQRLLGHRADQSSDQFSFCVSMYEALYGRRPFEGTSTTQLLQRIEEGELASVARGRNRVPAALHAAIVRGLAFSPAKRHPDLAHLLEAIERAARRPHRRWLAVGGLVTAALAVAWVTRDDASAEAPPAATTDEQMNATELAVATSDLPEPIDAPLPNDPAGVTVHRLDNGLTVYLAYRADRPRLATRVVVRAGLGEETAATRGLARLTVAAINAGSRRLGTTDFAAEQPFIERQHALLRKAARAESPKERDRLVREAHEAYRDSSEWLAPVDVYQIEQEIGTGRRLVRIEDGVVLHAEVAATRFEAWAKLLAEELREPVFRGFTGAAEGRLEHIGWIYAGSETAIAMEQLLAQTGAAAPYPDEAAASLRSFPLESAMEFHSTWYVPNNTAIVIVGDIRPDEALPVLREALGDWEAKVLPRTRSFADVAWPNERRFRSVESPGGRSVVVGFPLPPPSEGTRGGFEALLNVLAGQQGLLQSELGASKRVAGASAVIGPRGLILSAGVPPDGSHEQAEAALVGMLEAIAEHRIDERAWKRAMAQSALQAAQWARSPDDLADELAESYVDRRQWAEHAATLSPSGITKQDVVQAARRLRERGTAVVHAIPGEPWHPNVEPLGLAPTATEPTDGPVGKLGKELVALPVRELEPRFLIEGRHFERRPHGNAELISAAVEGPLFYATWVYPVGLRHDPFVCDAARYRARLWSEHVDALASIHLGIRCDTTTTTFEVTGIAARFDETMAGLQPALSDTRLDASRLPDEVERTLQARRRLREDPLSRTRAFHAYALRREASVDRWMPSDVDLRQAPVERFEQALAAMTAADPHVLYAGPDPKRFAAAVAAPSGTAVPLEAFTLQPPDRPTVYLLASSDAPPQAQVSVVNTGVDDPTGTLATALDRAPPPGLAEARELSVTVSNPTLFHFVVQKRPAHVWIYNGPPKALVDVVEAAVEDLPQLSPTNDMQTLRSRLEDEYRLGRVPDGRIPDVVLWWGPGQTVDPRMQAWSTIGRLDDTRLHAYFEAVGRQPAIVSLVVDPAAIDRARIERWGRIVEPDPADFLRDTVMTDTNVPGPR